MRSSLSARRILRMIKLINLPFLCGFPVHIAKTCRECLSCYCIRSLLISYFWPKHIFGGKLKKILFLPYKTSEMLLSSLKTSKNFMHFLQGFCDSFFLLENVSTDLTWHCFQCLFNMENHIDPVCQPPSCLLYNQHHYHVPHFFFWQQAACSSWPQTRIFSTSLTSKSQVLPLS